MTISPKHLWEPEHRYYCNDGNYDANDRVAEFQSWAEWHRNNAAMDVDMNLIFRWDWDEREAYVEQEGEEPWWPGDGGMLRLYIMGQRKGKFRVDMIYSMRREDEPSVREVLARHWETMRANWAPMSGPAEMVAAWSSSERDEFLVATDNAHAAGQFGQQNEVPSP